MPPSRAATSRMPGSSSSRRSSGVVATTRASAKPGAAFSASVVSKSRSTASEDISTSTSRSAWAPTRWRAPTSPVICFISGRNSRLHSIGLPCLPLKVGMTMARPSSGSKAAISRSIIAPVTSGMSPRQITTPSASAGSAASPALRLEDRPSA